MKLLFLGTSHGLAEKGRYFSSTLIETEKADYLIDLGAPIGNCVKDYDIPFEKVRAAFITHMHSDHTMNMSDYAFMCSCRVGMDSGTDRKYEQKELYLSEESAIDAYLKWIYAQHGEDFFADDKCVLKPVHEGEFYNDGNISVTAIPTKHLKRGVSYAYMIEHNGKRILFTGDLSADFSDFPEICEKSEFEAIICELTHYGVEHALGALNAAKTKKIIFNHVRDDKAAELTKHKDKIKFGYVTAYDGYSLEI